MPTIQQRLADIRIGYPKQYTKTDHEFSSTQIQCPPELVEKLKRMQSDIDSDDVGEEGLETDFHITTLFGLTTNDPDDVKECLYGMRPVKIVLGETSLFENPDADVLKVEVLGDDIHELNKRLKTLPHESIHPTYKPHITICYLKPGRGKKYVGSDAVNMLKFMADEIQFSNKQREKTPIYLVSETMTIGDRIVKAKELYARRKWDESTVVRDEDGTFKEFKLSGEKPLIVDFEGDAKPKYVTPKCPYCQSENTSNARTTGNGNAVCADCKSVFVDNYDGTSKKTDLPSLPELQELTDNYARRIERAMRYAKKPAAGQKSMFDEELHPRDEAGKFAVGSTHKIPGLGKRIPIHAKFYPGRKDGEIGVGWADRPEFDKPDAYMPSESAKHFVNDLSGVVDVPADSGNPIVDAIASGKGEVLGKGDDGIVFGVGDKVAKVSTTVPFQPFNPGHRTPAEATQRLSEQVDVNNKLADMGIPCIMKQDLVKHGDKSFAIRDKLDIPESLTKEQIRKVRNAVDKIHEVGYVVGDQIQVGLKDGQPYLYDLGKAQKARDENDYRDDSYNFQRFAKDMGQSGKVPPLAREAKQMLDSHDSFKDLIGDDEELRKDWEKERAELQNHVDEANAASGEPVEPTAIEHDAALARRMARAKLWTIKSKHEAKDESEPPKEPEKVGVPGMQRGLFGEDTSTGQKKLFDYVPPTKNDQKKAKQSDILDGVDSRMKRLLKGKETLSPADLLHNVQDEPLPGQKALFGDDQRIDRAIEHANRTGLTKNSENPQETVDKPSNTASIISGGDGQKHASEEKPKVETKPLTHQELAGKVSEILNRDDDTAGKVVTHRDGTVRVYLKLNKGGKRGWEEAGEVTISPDGSLVINKEFEHALRYSPEILSEIRSLPSAVEVKPVQFTKPQLAGNHPDNDDPLSRMQREHERNIIRDSGEKG